MRLPPVAVPPTELEIRAFVSTRNFSIAGKREATMNLPENFPNEILGEQERNLTGLVPSSESEINSGTRRLEHNVPRPLSTIPSSETSIQSSQSSKKKALFGGKGIAICAMLGLAVGIAIGAEWPGAHALTENLKSYIFREPTFADSSKAEPTAQAAPAAPSVADSDFIKIQNKLNAIAQELSSVQQDVKELAAGQEQLRKAQWSLAGLQARLLNMQTMATLKQNKQPSGLTESRKDRH